MIKLMKSSFYKEAAVKKNLALFILRTKKFSLGEQCKKFEQASAKKQKRRFAVFVSSGSAANLILFFSAFINIFESTGNVVLAPTTRETLFKLLAKFACKTLNFIFLLLVSKPC